MDQKLKKQLVPYFFTKNHFLSTKKHCKIRIFLANLRKTLDFFLNPRKNPRSPRQKPRTLDRVKKTPDLGRKP